MIHDRKLTEAICSLTCELREGRLDRAKELATKHDLNAAKEEILKAIASTQDKDIEAATLKLKKSGDKLSAAVADNQPISS